MFMDMMNMYYEMMNLLLEAFDERISEWVDGQFYDVLE